MSDKTEEVTDVVVVENKQPTAPVSIFDLQPEERVEFASKIATTLKGVIDRQGLYADIKGKKHITVEGWTTLGTLLGITPKESTVTRLEDGSYEAYVDLVRFSDGTVVGRGSALCSVRERRWGAADEYARRSMAVTRATSKAYRNGFSWIPALAGYSVTPAEEMPSRDITQELPYTATKEQREELKRVCKEREITDNAKLKAISEDLVANKVLLKDLSHHVGEFVTAH
jgi:hypothetical protein